MPDQTFQQTGVLIPQKSKALVSDIEQDSYDENWALRLDHGASLGKFLIYYIILHYGNQVCKGCWALKDWASTDFRKLSSFKHCLLKCRTVTEITLEHRKELSAISL